MSSSVASAASSDRRNIVVFLTDDQGYADLGCFGSESLETPNIDRLCKQGTTVRDRINSMKGLPRTEMKSRETPAYNLAH